MDDLLEEFDNLKISVFNKLSHLSGSVHNVTLGPDSVLNSTKTTPSQSIVEKICDHKTNDNREKNTNLLNDGTHYNQSLQQVEQELEAQRQEQVQKAIGQHVSKFQNFTKSHESNEWLIQQQNFIENYRQQEQLILKTVQKDDTNQMARNNELSKHYQQVSQRKQQIEQQLQQKKERQRIVDNCIENIRKSQLNFRQIYQEIVGALKASKFDEEIREAAIEELKLLKLLPNSFEEILRRCKSGTVIVDDVNKANEIVCQLKSLQDSFNDTIMRINNRKLDEQRQQMEKQQQDKLLINTDQFISNYNLNRYNEIRDIYERHVASFQQLLNDDQLKQFRFDCKKAINIPVNAISAVNSEHLNDKYVKLSNLLAGKTVIVADRQINASKHPQGIQFCMDLLAKKFILQGDLMISSNPEAAFAYSTIIVSLWNEFPIFGQLLLAHFYMKCPYLVPFYLMKTDQQTDQQYYESLGYQYVNGQIEKQDKYLKRLTGILRLYFAIMISRPKSNQQQNNPYNIKNAWIYLVSVLKLPPQLDVTATILHIFLETIGFQMENVYGKCFKKLLRIIETKFLPELKKLDTGGPVTRLEVLLQNYQALGKFERPNGLLSANFW